MWPSRTPDCFRPSDTRSVVYASAGSGSVSIKPASQTVDIDVVLVFQVVDGGAPLSVELKAQGADASAECQ